MWLEDCRIPFVDDDLDSAMEKRKSFTNTGNGHKNLYVGGLLETPIDTLKSINQQGRFTPNLLVCDDMLNDGNIIQYNKTRKDNGSYLWGHREEFVGTDNNPIVNKVKGQFFSDKGSNSRYYDLDLWFDKMIDEL
jgi:hypothetical protein